MSKNRILALAFAAACAPVAVQAQPTQWAVNGHYYEFIATSQTWQEAFDAAKVSSYLGLQGYLATITSADENTFATNVTGGVLAWLGGSDAGAATNYWTWRNGPEAGQAFTYTNWNPGEPNSYGVGEDYLQLNWVYRGGWNDDGAPNSPMQANGYLIEYGPAVPEPGAMALLLAGLAAVGTVVVRRR